MDEDEEFEGFDPEAIYPEPFSGWVLVKAGLDFVGHVLEAAHCALGVIGRGVISAEIFHGQQKYFAEVTRAELEMLPEVEE